MRHINHERYTTYRRRPPDCWWIVWCHFSVVGDAMNYMTLDYNKAIVQVEFYLETACGASEVIIVGVTYSNMGEGLTNKEYVPMPVRVDISDLLNDEDIDQLQDAVWAKLQDHKNA